MRDLVEIEVFAPVEIAKPIDRLIEALRGPEPLWWDFAYCDQCAMHSAVALGIAKTEQSFDVADGLGIPAADAYEIFLGGDIKERDYDRVRPRHVADALEHYKLTGVALSPLNFVELAAREKA